MGREMLGVYDGHGGSEQIEEFRAWLETSRSTASFGSNIMVIASGLLQVSACGLCSSGLH